MPLHLFLFDVAAKGFLLLALAACAIRLMARASAAARHGAWLLALLGLLLLPSLSAALPAWQVLPDWAGGFPFNGSEVETKSPVEIPESILKGQGQGAAEKSPQTTADLNHTPSGHEQPGPVAEVAKYIALFVPEHQTHKTHWIIKAWWLGVAFCLLPLLIGWLSLARLTRRCDRVTDPTVLDLLWRCRRALNLRCRVTLLQSGDRAMPMTWGIFRPKLLLPAGMIPTSPPGRGPAEGGGEGSREEAGDRKPETDDELRAIFLHELSHIQRHDCLAQFIAQLAAAIHWFNPLAWCALRRMAVEREQACDDRVLTAGTAPADYARQLLEIASNLQSTLLAPHNSIAMARRSTLEGRLLAILDATRNRNRPTLRTVAAAALLLACLLVPISMMRAEDASQPRFRARFVDSLSGKPVAGVKLLNREDKPLPGQSDANGWLEIAPLPTGKNELMAQAPNYVRWWSPQSTHVFGRFDDGEHREGSRWNFDYMEFDVQPGKQEVTITLEPGVTLRGKVLDPEGQPVAGATLSVVRAGSGNSITGDTRFSFPTDSAGRFEMLIPASHEAAYNLVAHDGKFGEFRHWANGVTQPFRTKPGEVVENMTIRLTRGATVTGRVFDKNGLPAAGRSVSAHPGDQFSNHYYDPKALTDESGRFELKFIRPGWNRIVPDFGWVMTERGTEGTGLMLSLHENETHSDVTLTAPDRQTNEEMQKIQIERLIREATRKFKAE